MTAPAPVPTEGELARWAALHAIAVAQDCRRQAQDGAATAACVVTGLLVVGAAIAAAMTMPLITVIIIGALIVALCLVVLAACWLIDRGRGAEPVFRERQGKHAAAAGRCPDCGVLLTAREPASPAEACAMATMEAEPELAVKAAPVLPPPLEHSPDWDSRGPAEVPFTEALEPSDALARAARLLPRDFDPDVDSLVGGIPPVPPDVYQQIRDGAL